MQADSLFSPPDTSTAESFCFGPVSSFILELLVTALYSSPVAYWTPSELGGSSASVMSFGHLTGRKLEWLAIPFSSGPLFIRTFHYDPSVLGGLAWWKLGIECFLIVLVCFFIAIII